MPEHEHSLSDEPELSQQSLSTSEKNHYLSQVNPATALSPYEDPKKVEDHFPSEE